MDDLWRCAGRQQSWIKTRVIPVRPVLPARCALRISRLSPASLIAATLGRIRKAPDHRGGSSKPEPDQSPVRYRIIASVTVDQPARNRKLAIAWAWRATCTGAAPCRPMIAAVLIPTLAWVFVLSHRDTPCLTIV